MFDMVQEPSRKQAVICVGADYEEFKPETMKGYFIHTENKSIKALRFATLNEAVAVAATMAEEVLLLSSVDDFNTDARAQ